MKTLTRPEFVLLLVVVALALAALLLPPHAQPQAYHAFADTRRLLGVPNAMDTLSNLAFAAGGAWGLAMLARGRLGGCAPVQRHAAAVTFVGLIAVGAGSGWYHLAPDDIGLAVDRAAMVIAFAGVLGIAAAQRVSARAGRAMLLGLLVAGPASVLAWHLGGSLTPYAVLQFGGLMVVVGLATRPAAAPGPSWPALVACYVLAKLAEDADAAVFAATAGVVSGHTLKHLLAAGSAVAIIVPWARAAARRA